MRPLRRIIPFSIRLKIEIEVNRSLAKGSRIIEIPFVLGNINVYEPSKVLSFGCFNDIISIELASMGFSVSGFDINERTFNHPNFHFVQGNFLETSNSIPDNSFDLAYALSSIEHVGLEVYGQSLYENGDKDVARIIHRLLKPGGKFLVTVPFGKCGLYPKGKPTYRKYERKDLRQLLNDFEKYSVAYYGWNLRSNWAPVAPETLEKTDGDTPVGVACIAAYKRN